MAYTPELSQRNSCILRRVAWALKQPMTNAIELIFEDLVKRVDAETVCKACKDPSKCSTCPFSRKG